MDTCHLDTLPHSKAYFGLRSGSLGDFRATISRSFQIIFLKPLGHERCDVMLSDQLLDVRRNQ